MSAGGHEWRIAGQGLAGSCLAWTLWWRGVGLRLVDRGRGGSSRVAAGMVNPVTGKNFEPSWRIGEFIPAAMDFYQRVAGELGVAVWHPLRVLRLAGDDKEWGKICGKLESDAVKPWVEGVEAAPDGWAGAVALRGGGRVDTAGFVARTRTFFEERGMFEEGEIGNTGAGDIVCDGAEGLVSGRYGPHRCAKGEILTVAAPGWDAGTLRIGGGGWLVPVGDGCYKVGSTYEWHELDEEPSAAGRERVLAIARRLGGSSFEVVKHEAGVRPILRRSQPLIGPLAGGGWMLNGLGSKGALYAPGMAARLAEWVVAGTEPEPEVDLRTFLSEKGGSGGC